MLLYICSTLLHSFKPCKARTVFNIMDHAAIYVLIAGSYTPFVLITIQGTLGWTLFGVIWGLAIAGIIYKIFMTGKLKLLSTSVYLLMGWMVMFAIKPLYAGLTPTGFWLLATGGIMFTVGAVFTVSLVSRICTRFGIYLLSREPLLCISVFYFMFK